MSASHPQRNALRFGDFELNAATGELYRNGAKLHLQDQPLQILQILAARPGEIVNREELRQKIWPSDTFVDFDHGINNAIKRLREALGDTAETPHYVETLPRRGYRFVGKLEREAPTFRSLAVLPLENLSHDPEQEYFAEGLTEALITTLAKVGGLRVVSRTSAMLYKGARKPLGEIARELAVDTIVEGTVLRVGHRVRITAQLIDAAKESHLWAESYERHIRDVLHLQAEVAEAIAKQVQVKLTPQELAHLAQTQAVNPEAYEAYLKGRYHWLRRSAEELPKAVRYFEQAIEIDRTYAAAYAGLADSLSGLGVYFVAPEQGCGKAKQLALRALEMDAGLAEAHCSFAWATAWYDYDFCTAEREFERSIELNPRYATAHLWYGFCLAAMGRYEESYAEFKRAIRLDPHNTYTYATFGFACYLTRRYDEAINLFKKSLELDPGIGQAYCGLGWAYMSKSMHDDAIATVTKAVELAPRATLFLGFVAEAHAAAGHRQEAQKILDRLLALSKEQYVSPHFIARIYLILGNKDETLTWLETALRERASLMVLLKTDPRFDELRPEPRFQALIRAMKFPDDV
jgi:TolB-like protein/Tfp pilus assembly protein PilF